MEELKHEQEMRERRNQDRESWRDTRHSDNSTVSALSNCVSLTKAEHSAATIAFPSYDASVIFLSFFSRQDLVFLC